MVRVEDAAPALISIEAERRVPGATIQLTHIELRGATESSLLQDDTFRLDLCLTPRTPNARICFSNHWARHRFERPGTVFLVPPGESLQARSDGGRQSAIVCLLQPQMMRQWLDDAIIWDGKFLDASSDIASDGIQYVMMRLSRETRHPGFASDAMCEAMVLQLAIELGRYYADIDDGGAATKMPGWRLRRIEERLREVRSPPTLAELAGMCHVSVRQLTRSFRASRNRSIGDHIAESRIEQAKHLLAGGETVKSIAYSMGFGSPSSFCHAFRTATGCTPLQYQRQDATAAPTALN